MIMKNLNLFIILLSFLIPLQMQSQPTITIERMPSAPDFWSLSKKPLFAFIDCQWIEIGATSLDSARYDSRIFKWVGKSNTLKIDGGVNVFSYEMHCFARVKPYFSPLESREELKYYLETKKYNLH
jgi:hypothetical protein